MEIKDALDEITKLKRQYRCLISNILPNIKSVDGKIDVFLEDGGIVFVTHEPNRKRAYFAVSSPKILPSLLRKCPVGTVLEYLWREKNDLRDIFIEGHMKYYATYGRMEYHCEKNYYEIPEVGRRKVLQKFYDPLMGEYPTVDDIPVLDRINREVFDVNCDDIFTYEEWEEVIRNKTVLVARENEKIVAYYCWKIEGKKVYSNVSVNTGAGNMLYNLERRVFTELFNAGYRVFCGWANLKNSKAIGRINKDPVIDSEKIIQCFPALYNDIFVMQ